MNLFLFCEPEEEGEGTFFYTFALLVADAA